MVKMNKAKNSKEINLEIPKITFASLRKRKKLKQQDLKLLEELIQMEIAQYLEVLKLSNKKIYKLKKYICKNLEDAENSAIKFRNEMNVSQKLPISNLTFLLEKKGIYIIKIKNMENKFKNIESFSEVVEGVPFIILIDRTLDGGKQKLTLAHELGHLILNIENKELKQEELCERFANALLMPKRAMINEFGDYRVKLNFHELESFKKEFQVNYHAIIIRLRELQITPMFSVGHLLVHLHLNKEKYDDSVIPLEEPYQFQKMVYQLEAYGKIETEKACEFLKVSKDHFRDSIQYL